MPGRSKGDFVPGRRLYRPDRRPAGRKLAGGDRAAIELKERSLSPPPDGVQLELVRNRVRSVAPLVAIVVMVGPIVPSPFRSSPKVASSFSSA